MNNCIGVFDSGVGGLSVLRALRGRLPGVPLRYLADSAHAPYGGREAAHIMERSVALTQRLLDDGAALIVVACNTATVQAIDSLRERWPALSPEQAERIFRGEPYPGMTEDQAEAAVGRLVLAREPAVGRDGEVAWRVGRRPRPAELRLYTEGRERGPRARTFEEFLRTKVRATLTFRDGILISIDAPAGSSPGAHWP